MADKLNDGGPAFPAFEAGRQGFADIPTTHDRHYPGMTLRDYFAAQALGYLMRHFSRLPETGPLLATDAYLIADAMLAARAITTARNAREE